MRRILVRILAATDLRHSSRAFLEIEDLKAHKLLIDMLKLFENPTFVISILCVI